MKGILIEPGKSPEVTSLPDTLQGIEARLQCPCEQKVCPARRQCWCTAFMAEVCAVHIAARTSTAPSCATAGGTTPCSP